MVIIIQLIVLTLLEKDHLIYIFISLLIYFFFFVQEKLRKDVWPDKPNVHDKEFQNKTHHNFETY